MNPDNNQNPGMQPGTPSPMGAAGPQPNPTPAPQPNPQPTTAQPMTEPISTQPMATQSMSTQPMATQPTPTQPMATPAANFNPAPATTPKSNKNLFIIIGAVIVVALIAVIAIIMINSGKSESNSGNQTQTGGTNQDNKDQTTNGSGNMVNPNVGGTLTVGKVSLTYSDSWTEDENSITDTKTIYNASGDTCFILNMVESSKHYTLDEFAQTMADAYTAEGYTTSEELKAEQLGNTTWQHTRMRNSETVNDFWFYINGDQYYTLTRATTATFAILTQEDHAILDSLTIK